MIILGLNLYSVSASACLVSDGKIVAAATEDIFNRKKSFCGFPAEAIRYCLNQAGAQIADLDFIAVSYRPDGNRKGRKAHRLADQPSLFSALKRQFEKSSWPPVEEHFRACFPKEKLKAEVVHVNHQLCHLSLSFHLSGFDTATVVNFDDMGDFASTSWGLGLGDQINFEGQIHYPHSIGLVYRTFMQYLGFDPWDEEDKLTLAAEDGLPRYVEQIGKLIDVKNDGSFSLNLDYFEFHKRRDRFEWSGSEPTSRQLYSSALEAMIGSARSLSQPLTARHRDIAYSVVIVIQEVIIKILRHLQNKHGNVNLALSGHLAHYHPFICKIRTNTPFENIYIPPLANDASSAIGAAQAIAVRVGEKRFIWPKSNQIGPGFSRAEILDAVDAYRERLTEAHCSIETDNSFKTVGQLVAIEISIGNMVAWYQGRMEFSSRSFGARSILYDPRRDDFDVVLTHKVRPVDAMNGFAVSILKEDVRNWFDIDSEQNERLLYARTFESKRYSIPAIKNMTGTAHVHIVDYDIDPIFHSFLKEFNKKSLYPFVIETPFRLNGITVNTPADAIESMLASQIDMLVLGDVMIRRNKKAPVKLQVDGRNDLDVYVR